MKVMAASVTLALDPAHKDIPLYQQVQHAIAEHIAAGRLVPGQQLPSERRLCARFGISRVTARRALAALVDQELIEASPGKGWFVSDGPLSEPPNALLSFTALARERGLEPSSRVLLQKVRDATMDEAESLQVAPGSQLLELERVRLLEGLPVAVDHCLIPLGQCPELADADFTVDSVYEILRTKARITPTSADCTLEATAAGPVIAPLLDLDPSSPVLVSRQTTFDQRGGPVESSRLVYRGDRYRFRTTLTAGSQQLESQ
jgi:GntR family transcriptional regulator